MNDNKNKTATPGAQHKNKNALKGAKELDSILHARCYKEEKSNWTAAAKLTPERKLTVWAREVLNREAEKILNPDQTNEQ